MGRSPARWFDRRTVVVGLFALAGLTWAATLASGAVQPPPPGVEPDGQFRLTVTTLAPTNGSTVSGAITWQVAVSGGTASRVDFTIDGTVKWSQTTSPYLYGGATGALDTTKLSNGAHALTAAAYPTKGPPARSSVTVIVTNAGVPPTWTVPPAVTGTAQVGQTLTTSAGSWNGSQPINYSYQWRRCDATGANCGSISGATAQSYTATSGDLDSTLRTQVTATNGAGSSWVQSAQTAKVSSAPSAGSIYWGAYEEGPNTYGHLYGGTWNTAPWDCASSSPLCATENTFAGHAGKEPSILHWGMNAPPWVHDFNYWQPALNLVLSRGDINAVDMSTGTTTDKDIANGVYDASIRTWMQQAAAWGHPFFLILDVEMNGTWEPYSPGVNGNTAADFVNMWRHMHDLAVQAGATNITWVWAPNVDPAKIFTPYSQLYPGDGYVDWTGLDGFNKDGKSTFSWLYSSSYTNLLAIAATKPIMITQVSSVEGGIGKAAWITDMLTQLPVSFPQIKAFVWFNWRINENGSWWDWEIESSASAQSAFASGVASSYYATGGTYGSLPLGSKITPPS